MDLTYEQIRKEFAEGVAKRDEGLSTPENIARHDNISYGPYDKWNLMDIYYLEGTNTPQPVIVSIHGGGWVYGTKEVYQYYCMDLSQRGFAVVNFNYRLAPENPYPSALEDINALFSWVCEHGKEYYLDLDRLYIVGDSAGAQLAAQYTTIVTNPEYQKLFKFNIPKLLNIKAVGLNCGIYDTGTYVSKSGDPIIDAYIGKEKKAEDLKSIDNIKYLTNKFPPSIITTAYYDFLKDNAEPMYEKLQSLGILCKLKIFGAPNRKEIAHVFHTNIRLPEAIECNEMECSFFKKYQK